MAQSRYESFFSPLIANRYMVPAFPYLWRSLRALQFIMFTTTLSSAVKSTQFVLPISGFYIKEYTAWTIEKAGMLSGVMIGGYYVARGLTAKAWLIFAQKCGYRTVLTVALIGELALTIALGVCENIWISISIRIVAGAVSPLSILSQTIIQKLTIGIGQEVPMLAQNITVVVTIGQAFSAVIAGCLAYPLESKLVHSDSYFSKKPYLLPCFIISILQFFAILCFYIDFPDLHEGSETNKAAAKGNTEKKPGKYAELTESNGQIDLQRSEAAIVPTVKQEQGENPVTERKEIEGEGEEELPAYLQYYEIEEIEEVHPSAPVNFCNRPLSNRSDKVRTLPYSSRKIHTTRGPVVSTIASPEEQRSTIGETEKGSSWPKNRSEKTTHISFIEENFPNQRAVVQTLTLDDPFKRSPEESKKPLYSAYFLLWSGSLYASWVEGTMIAWLSSLEELNVVLVSVIVAGSVGGIWALAWSFSVLCPHVPLSSAAIFHAFISINLTLLPVLLLIYRPEGVIWVLLLVGMQLAMKYFTVFGCTFAGLLIGDAVVEAARPLAIQRGDIIATLFKGIGYIGGPLVYSLSSQWEWPGSGLSFIMGAGIGLLTLAAEVRNRGYFPRFRSVPYVR